MHKEGTPYHADPAEHRVQAGVGVVLVIAEKTLQVCVKALARHWQLAYDQHGRTIADREQARTYSCACGLVGRERKRLYIA